MSMNKQVHNKVIDQRLCDGSTQVEDVTSVDTPEIEFVSDEVDIPGATAKINIVNPYQVSAMTVTINHNHGNGCDGLNTPELHQIELRMARQVISTANGNSKPKSTKVRFSGTPMKVSRGSIERGNPRGMSVQYSVQRYEEEENGKTIILIDALAGILQINGKDYAGTLNRILN